MYITKEATKYVQTSRKHLSFDTKLCLHFLLRNSVYIILNMKFSDFTEILNMKLNTYNIISSS